MSTRIQVVLDNREKAMFRAAAKREGVSLSAWVKGCAMQALEAQKRQHTLNSKEALRSFFAECDELEQGLEPDWKQHKRIIEESATSGITES